MDEDALTDVLENALGLVPKVSATARKISIDDPIMEELREAQIDHELSKIVLPILERQPEFKDRAPMIRSGGGATGFQSQFAVSKLVREARNRGSAEAAVLWLKKVLGTHSGTGLCIQTLWGICPTEQISVVEGVDLLPFDSIPPSHQKKQLEHDNWGSYAGGRFPPPVFAWTPPNAVLIAKAEIHPFLIDASMDSISTDDDTPQVYSKLDEVRLCLCLEGPSTVHAGPRWFQFEDPDLEAAILAGGISHSHHEVLPSNIPDISVGPETVVLGACPRTQH